MLKLFVIDQLVYVETCRLEPSTYYLTLRREGGGWQFHLLYPLYKSAILALRNVWNVCDSYLFFIS